MAVCQVCGKQNPPGVEYCEDCGAALVADPAAGSTRGAEPGSSQSAAGAGAWLPSGEPAVERAAEGAPLPDQPPPGEAASTFGAPGGQAPSEGTRRPRLLVK